MCVREREKYLVISTRDRIQLVNRFPRSSCLTIKKKIDTKRDKISGCGIGRQLDSSYSVGEHGGTRIFPAKNVEILSIGAKHEATDNILQCGNFRTII